MDTNKKEKDHGLDGWHGSMSVLTVVRDNNLFVSIRG